MAWTYYVTFRIADKTVNGATYDDRRQALVEAMNENNGYWDETTSFFLVHSSLHTDALCKKASAKLSAKDDMLLVIDPSDASAACFGVVRHESILKSFFPKLKKAA